MRRALSRTRRGSQRSASKPWNTPGPRRRAYMSQRPCSPVVRPVNTVGSAPVLKPSTVASGRRAGSAGALHALRALGVTRADTFAAAARETLVAWDRQLHAGERTAELA